MAGVAEPDDGAVRQGADAVEGGDRRQPGDVLPARIVRAVRDALVDVLDRDRLHLDDHLVLTRHGVRELFVAGDAADLVQHRRLHHDSRPKNAAIRRCHAGRNREERAGGVLRRPRNAAPWCPVGRSACAGWRRSPNWP